MKEGKRNRKHQRIDAFESVVQAYEERLLRYAASITGDWSLAQDVVQESFLKLFRRHSVMTLEGKALSGWLFRVVHNCAVDLIRKRSRRSDHEHKHAESLPSADHRHPGIVEGAHAAAVRKAIDELSARERELITLKVYEDCSYKEMAEITGLTIGNVGYILHHAMKKLATRINQGGSNE